MKLVWLFYQQMRRSSIAPLQKKLLLSSKGALFVAEGGKWFLSCCLVIILCSRSSVFGSSFTIGLLLLLATSPFIAVLLDSGEKLQRDYHYDYLRLSSEQDDVIWRRLVIIHYVSYMLRMLPTVFPPSVALVVKLGWVGAALVWFGQATLFFLYVMSHVMRGTKFGEQRVFSGVLSCFFSLAVGYMAMIPIVSLLQLSRHAVKTYGLSISYLSYMDGLFVKWQQWIHERVFTWHGMVGLNGGVLAASGLAIAAFALGSLRSVRACVEAKTYVLYEWYQRVIQSSWPPDSENALLYKDTCLLMRKASQLDKPPLLLFLPGEWFLVTGANIALFPFIHNLFVICFICLFEMYIVMTGTLRAVASTFSQVFFFESDIERLLVFRLLDPPPLVQLIQAKWTLLRRIGVYPCVAALGLLAIEWAGWFRGNALIVVLLSIIIMPLYPLVIKRILRTDYEVFCFLLSSGEKVELASPRDYAGYMVVAAGNHLFHRLFIYVTIFSSLISAFFVLLRGEQWGWYSILFVIALYIVLWGSTRYSIDRRKEGKG